MMRLVAVIASNFPCPYRVMSLQATGMASPFLPSAISSLGPCSHSGRRCSRLAADHRQAQPGPEMLQRRSHEAELREVHSGGNGNGRDQKRPCEVAETILVGDKSADHGYVLSPQLRAVVKSFGGCPQQ